MVKLKKKKKEFNREVTGLIIISMGMLSVLSLLSDKMGIIGKLLRDTYLALMGFGGYIFPLVIIFTGVLFIINKVDIAKDKKTIFLLIIFLSFITILDISKVRTDSFREHINLAFEYSKSGLGGGIIGGFFGYLSFKLFGSLGSYIIFFIIALVNFLLITEIEIKNFFKKIIKENEPSKTKKDNNTLNIMRKKENTKSNKKKDEKIKIFDYNNNKNFNKENFNKVKKKNINFNEESTNTYNFPHLDLLKDRRSEKSSNDRKEVLSNAKKIEETMENFGIKAEIVQISKGPTITCYELQPAPGVKVSKIVNLSNDIALNLATSDVRIEAPIPGKAAVGIEVPNKNKLSVPLKEILMSEDYKNINTKTPLALGKDISGKPIITNMEKMPHLLIAGATGSGKSVCINTIIMSILYKSSPEDVKLILIDPKVVELNIYNGIPHLLIPVVTDAKKARNALSWSVEEMTRRYKIFAQNNVRDIHSYNNKIKNNKESESEVLPQIVIIIDELADLMMVSAQEIEDYICRLAQMARAAGMYLIVATQRPSVDVITGTIKANIPSRISFAVTSQADSRTILDMGGAEKLLGKGDMLFYPSNFSKPLRVQGAFVDDEEVVEVVKFLKEQKSVEYDEEIIDSMENKSIIDKDKENEDELLPEAINLVIEEDQASISLLQRKLRIGYARAARLIDEMEERGIVGGHEGSKPRKVLIDKETFNSE
ncbi:DNA translocase FtsK 4TM domain-containing protein [Anaerosalibacter massiliensis]|uniref:DNA translocase FtsK 4TM domain-containing protein n=2 Tax=Anaerosalibacter massiliensis TaxID=1347392 RepID=A0A9X2MFP1_9FIRM|nr:DNA translocase FtsK 4TM domain-containing protein [Anaerosalibacter massiliensis]MCR2042716.1 DNA translocase FtsK 4TM domain-containing protein [Anaerosalibacter massiliensis]